MISNIRSFVKILYVYFLKDKATFIVKNASTSGLTGQDNYIRLQRQKSILCTLLHKIVSGLKKSY